MCSLDKILPHQQIAMVDRSRPILIRVESEMNYFSSAKRPTSDANNNRRFSPPDKPLIRPGKPMTVFSAFFRLSYQQKSCSSNQIHVQSRIFLTASSTSSTRFRRSCFVIPRGIRNIA